MALDAQQKKDAKYLAKKTREELNVLAAQHGVEDAGNEELYKTKDDLAEAIVAAGYKRDSQDAPEEEQPDQPSAGGPAQESADDTPSDDSQHVDDTPPEEDAPADTPSEEVPVVGPRNAADEKADKKAEEAKPGTTTEPLPVIGGVGPVIELPKRKTSVEATNEAAQQLADNMSRKQLENLASVRGITSPQSTSIYPDNVALANEVIRTGYDAGAYPEPAEFGASNVPAAEQAPKPPYSCKVCRDTGLEQGVPSNLAKECPNCGGTPDSVKSKRSTSAKPSSTKKPSTSSRKSKGKGKK